MIIDTHCHAGINWFEPIENLIFQMDKNSVDKAVLIQHKGSTNNYLYECLNRFSDKFSIVPAVNWNENLENQLKEFKNNGASGIRVYLDFPEIFNKKGDDLFKNCAEKNFVISVASNLKTFSSSAFSELVKRNPKTTFIIEHLAGANNFPEDKNSNDYLDEVLKLSQNNNLYIKIPGLGEIYERPKILDLNNPFYGVDLKLIKKVFQSFSSKYLMWGSDFPPVSNREGYRNALIGIYNINFFNEKDKEDIFFNVPEKLFF